MLSTRMLSILSVHLHVVRYIPACVSLLQRQVLMIRLCLPRASCSHIVTLWICLDGLPGILAVSSHMPYITHTKSHLVKQHTHYTGLANMLYMRGVQQWHQSCGSCHIALQVSNCTSQLVSRVSMLHCLQEEVAALEDRLHVLRRVNSQLDRSESHAQQRSAHAQQQVHKDK